MEMSGFSLAPTYAPGKRPLEEDDNVNAKDEFKKVELEKVDNEYMEDGELAEVKGGITGQSYENHDPTSM